LRLLRGPPGGFFDHSSGKNKRIRTKLGRKKLRHKGKLQKNLGVDRMRGAPRRRSRDFIFLSVHMSPVRLTPSERKRPLISASNNVILLLIYARRQKFRIFLRGRRRREDRKRRFSRFLGWMFCRSATAYIEHQICTQKAWIISGDVVDVPFGVSDPHE